MADANGHEQGPVAVRKLKKWIRRLKPEPSDDENQPQRDASEQQVACDEPVATGILTRASRPDLDATGEADRRVVARDDQAELVDAVSARNRWGKPQGSKNKNVVPVAGVP